MPASAKEPLPRSHCVAGTAPTGWSWRNRSANQKPETGAADLEARHGGRSYIGQGACPAGRSRRRHAGGHLGVAEFVLLIVVPKVSGGIRRSSLAGAHVGTAAGRGLQARRVVHRAIAPLVARAPGWPVSCRRRQAVTWQDGIHSPRRPLRRTESGVPSRLRAGAVVTGRQSVGLAGLSDPSWRWGLTVCRPAVTQISPGAAVWLAARPARHGATPRWDADQAGASEGGLPAGPRRAHRSQAPDQLAALASRRAGHH